MLFSILLTFSNPKSGFRVCGALLFQGNLFGRVVLLSGNLPQNISIGRNVITQFIRMFSVTKPNKSLPHRKMLQSII